METLTLEQRRSENTWEVCARWGEQHTTFVKSLSALIMNSGLMQVIAFCNEKGNGGQEHIYDVVNALQYWLVLRFPQIFMQVQNFEGFMEKLMVCSSEDYQAINAEALAWLRWLRQLAAARTSGA